MFLISRFVSNAACNVESCRFDGQDCVNVTHYDPLESTSSQTQTDTALSPYCSSGCPNNWLGDKVCDRSCKNAACGYDAGDCGYSLIVDSLPQIQPAASFVAAIDSSSVLQEFILQHDTNAFFVNLSAVFPLGGSWKMKLTHDNEYLVRTATVAAAARLATVVLFHEAQIDDALLLSTKAEERQYNREQRQAQRQLDSEYDALNETAEALWQQSEDELETLELEALQVAQSDPQRSVRIVIRAWTRNLGGENDPPQQHMNVSFVVHRPRDAPPQHYDLEPEPMYEDDLFSSPATDSYDDDADAAAGDVGQTVLVPEEQTEPSSADTSDLNAASHSADHIAAEPAVDADSTNVYRSSRSHEPQLAKATSVVPPQIGNQDSPPVVEEAVAADSSASRDTASASHLSHDARSPASTPHIPRNKHQASAPIQSHTNEAHSTQSAESDRSHVGSPNAGHVIDDESIQLPDLNAALSDSADLARQLGSNHVYSNAEMQHMQANEIASQQQQQQQQPPKSRLPVSPPAPAVERRKKQRNSQSSNVTPQRQQVPRSNVVDAQVARRRLLNFDSAMQQFAGQSSRIGQQHSMHAAVREHNEAELLRELPDWRQLHQVEVLGIPINATQASHSVDSSAPVSHSNETVILLRDLPSSSQQTTPHNISEQYGWQAKDAKTALHIQIAKRKQLWLDMFAARQETIRQVVDQHEQAAHERLAQLSRNRMQRRQRQQQQQPVTLWPWEMPLDQEARESAWAYLDHKQEAKDKQADTHAISLPLAFASPHLNDSSSASLHPSTNPTSRRLLLDTFGASLRFVNDLYTETFGRESRKAPAHMPHHIDRQVMIELQSRWPQLYDTTSSHRFRHGTDMQFSFAYYYYVMNARQNFSLPALFESKLDHNGDGVLNYREVKWMGHFIAGKRVIKEDVSSLEQNKFACTLDKCN